MNTPGAVRRRVSIQRLSAQASQSHRHFQIGPRIRVGGTLGKIGQSVKTGMGKIDKAAAPFVSMIPGVGQIAGPLMNVAGNAMDTTNGGGIKSFGDVGRVGLQSALMAGGGKLLGGAAGSLLGKIPGVSSVEGALGSIPGVSELGGALKSAGGSLSHIPGLQSIEGALTGGQGGSGLLGGIGSFLGGNGGKNALGVAQGINAAMLQKQSSDYAKRAMGDVQNSYNERAPLRSAGISGMMNPGAGASAAIAALPQTGNPYARKLPPVSAAPSAGGV